MDTASHELQLLDETGRTVGTCGCGWSTGRTSTAAEIERRWTFHVQQRRATATAERAAHLASVARDRASRLLADRAALRARREAVQHERRRLRVQLQTVRESVRPVPSTRHVLETAREMASMTHQQLWTEYFAIGGCLTESQLTTALTTGRGLGAVDHDLVALVLNEWFTERGFGRPLDLERDQPWT